MEELELRTALSLGVSMEMPTWRPLAAMRVQCGCSALGLRVGARTTAGNLGADEGRRG